MPWPSTDDDRHGAEVADRQQREEERRLAEHDAQATCDHYARTDWLDVNVCGCGERVFP